MKDVAEIVFGMNTMNGKMKNLMSGFAQTLIQSGTTTIRSSANVAIDGIEWIKRHYWLIIGGLTVLFGTVMLLCGKAIFFALTGVGAALIVNDGERRRGKMKEYTVIYKAEITEILEAAEFEKVPKDEKGKVDERKLAELTKVLLDVDDVNVTKIKVFEIDTEHDK